MAPPRPAAACSSLRHQAQHRPQQRHFLPKTLRPDQAGGGLWEVGLLWTWHVEPGWTGKVLTGPFRAGRSKPAPASWTLRSGLLPPPPLPPTSLWEEQEGDVGRQPWAAVTVRRSLPGPLHPTVHFCLRQKKCTRGCRSPTPSPEGRLLQLWPSAVPLCPPAQERAAWREGRRAVSRSVSLAWRSPVSPPECRPRQRDREQEAVQVPPGRC